MHNHVSKNKAQVKAIYTEIHCQAQIQGALPLFLARPGPPIFHNGETDFSSR